MRAFKYLMVGITLFGYLNVCGQAVSEKDLLKEADALFENGEYELAFPKYSQLVSLSNRNADYRFKYGACMLFADRADEDGTTVEEKAINQLKIAVEFDANDARVYYYLGYAQHLNYLFADAIKSYEKFNSLATSKQKEELDASRQIQMCNNGIAARQDITNIYVLSKQNMSVEQFFRAYDLRNQIGGQLIVAEELATKYDKKQGHTPLVHVPANSDIIYFSSYGKDGANGLDIYRVKRLPNGDWADAQICDGQVNTQYDEDFPFLHPDGYLYFSSKGHTSMGGYDVFRSVYDLENDTYAKPENMAYALNTPNDDIFYIADSVGQFAYFASSRESAPGTINVYNVTVERFPISIGLIKGEFISDIDETDKVATITIEDPATNEIIGIFKSNNTDASYFISVPQTGVKYKFIVESEKSTLIHYDYVHLPAQFEVRVLKQEIVLYEEGGTEKLMIRNLFDETVEDEDYLIAQFMRDAANLEENYDPSLLMDNATENSSEVETIEVPDLNTDQESLVEWAFESANEDQETADHAKEVMDAAYILADEKLEEAALLADQAQEIYDNMDQYESEYEQQQALSKADRLNNQSQDLMEDAVAAMNVGNAAQQEYEYYQDKAEDSFEFATNLEQSFGESPEDAMQMLEDEIARLEEAANDVRTDPVEEAYEEADAAQIEANELVAELEELRADEKEIRDRINALERQYDNAKDKDKPDIQAEIDMLNGSLDEILAEIPVLNDQIREQQLLADELAEEAALLDGLNSGQITVDVSDNALTEEDIFNLQNDVADLSASIDENAENIDQIKDDQLLAQNTTDVTDSSTDVTDSSTDVTDSSTDVTDSSTDVTDSSADVTDSSTDVTDSSTDVTDSSTDVTDSSTDVTDSSTDVTDSSSDATDSSTDVTDSSTDVTDSSTDVTDSSTDVTDSSSDATDSSTDVTDSSTDVTDSSTDVTDSSTDVTDSSTDVTDSSTDVTDSSSDATDSSTDVTDSSTDVTDSSTDVTDSSTDVPDNSTDVTDNTTTEATQDTRSYDLTISFNSVQGSSAFDEISDDIADLNELYDERDQLLEDIESAETDKDKTKLEKQLDKLNGKIEKSEVAIGEEMDAVYNEQFDNNTAAIESQLDDLLDNGVIEFGDPIIQQVFDLQEYADNYSAEAQQLRDAAENTDDAEQQNDMLKTANELDQLALDQQEQAINLFDITYNDFVADNGDLRATDVTDTSTDVTDASTDVTDTSTDATDTSTDATDASTDVTDASTDVTDTSTDVTDASTDVTDSSTDATDTSTDATDTSTDATDTSTDATDTSTDVTDASTDVTDTSTDATDASTDVADISTNERFGINPDEVPVSDEQQAIADNYPEYNLVLNLVATAEYKDEMADQEEQRAEDIRADAQDLLQQSIDVREAADVETNPDVQQELYDQADQLQQTAEAMYDEAAVAEDNATELRQSAVDDLEEADNQMATLDQDVQDGINSMQQDIADNNTNASDTSSDNSDSSTDIADNTTDVADNSTDIIDNTTDSSTDSADNSTDVTDSSTDHSDNSIAITDNTSNTSDATTYNMTLDINAVPEVVTEDVFTTTTASSYNDANPIPITNEQPSGLVYKVQVGAFSQPIPQDLFSEFAPITGDNTSLPGITRYTVGYFTNYSSAYDARNMIRGFGYSSAFVVAYCNGERVVARGEVPCVYNASDVVADNFAVNNNTTDNTTTDVADNSNTNTADNTNVTDNTTDYSSDFTSDNAAADYYNDASAAPATQVEVVAGLFYTVQIGVYDNPVPATTLYNITPLNSQLIPSGQIRYSTGQFCTVNEATNQRNQIRNIGISDAWVTAYYNGERITISEARDIYASQGDAVLACGGNAPDLSSNNTVSNSDVTNNTIETTPVTDNADLIQPDEMIDASAQGIEFKILLGEFTDEIPQDVALAILTMSHKGINRKKQESGSWKYTSGSCQTYQDAEALQDEFLNAGVSSATIIATQNGQEIPVSQALDIINQ